MDERFVLNSLGSTITVKQPLGQENVVKTKYLFYNLLRVFRPDLILDVGSMDGSDSMRFRLMSPGSKIIAIEANPYHFSKMQNDTRLTSMNIEVRHRLASTEAVKGKFFITKGAVAGVIGGNMGTSSSLKPINESDVAEEIQVDTVRLDDVIAAAIAPKDWAAMWLDVEGAAYEVLSSVARAKQQIALLHVEVELVEYWRGQKLKSDVVKLANEMGLILLARSKSDKQQDLVFINEKLLIERAGGVKLAMLLTKWLGPASSRMLEKF
jgi:FkbM family methyltransferase